MAGLSRELEKALTALGILDRLPQDSFTADLDEAKRAAPPGYSNADATPFGI